MWVLGVYAQSNHIENFSAKPITVITLYCGCGGRVSNSATGHAARFLTTLVHQTTIIEDATHIFLLDSVPRGSLAYMIDAHYFDSDSLQAMHVPLFSFFLLFHLDGVWEWVGNYTFLICVIIFGPEVALF